MSEAFTNSLEAATPCLAPGAASTASPPTAGRLSPDARDVLVMFNPAAGARRRTEHAEAVVEAISRRGFVPHKVECFEALGVQTRALAAQGGLRAVVAVGGDGTIGAVLNGSPAGTPIAVAPAGTENLLSKYLGHTRRPDEVASLVERGVLIRLDSGNASGRLFTLMISAGFDAEVVRRVHERRSGNITHLAYANPILQTVRKYQYPPLQIEWTDAEGKTGEVVGSWVFGLNLPRYAQGLPIAPEACGLDGQLDLSVFERGGSVAAVWYLWNVLRRRRHKVDSVTTVRPVKFRIDSPQPGVSYQLDGEPGGSLPVEVSVEPGRLALLVPERTARRLGFEVPDGSR